MEPIKSTEIIKVEVRRRLTDHDRGAARRAAENIYRAFGIKNPYKEQK